MKTKVFAAMVLALGLAGGGVRADPVGDAFAAAHMTVVPCRAHNDAQEKADHDLALKALQLLEADDVAGAEAMMPDLRAAQGRSPDVAPSPELCGTTLNVFSDSVADLVMASAVVAKDTSLAGVGVALKGEMPYGTISFVIGWLEYEHKDFEAALADYSRGRLNAPDDVTLASEYASTLSALGRAQEAYDAASQFLAGHPALDDKDRAVMLRREGYSLIDLNRLDDAQAAYEASLKLDPDNSVALGDLDYIKQQRASH